jgi:hypothetical protein
MGTAKSNQLKWHEAERIADRRKEWATVWKQRAHLDNMRAFQWRKLATKRLELLRRNEWVFFYSQSEYVCLFCGATARTLEWAGIAPHQKHADDCELAKELELDAQRQADEYLESEDAHIEVTDD